MKNIYTILRKELQVYFNNPTAYIIIVAFLLLWEFLFFQQVFLIGEVSVRGLLGLLPWLSLLVIPALTMGAIAEEKSEGTIEFLLTRPIKSIELVLGKFFGILIFFAISTAFVFPIAWSFGFFGDIDWGQTFAQYLGGILLASVLSSLGIALSSFSSNQVTAFILSVTASFFLIISGTELVSAHLPLFFAPFLEQLSAFNHFNSLSRGVIDMRDLWYFVSFTAVFLGISFLNVLRIKYGNKRKTYRQHRIAIALFFGIAVFSNIVGARIPGRIDLTEEKLYTLSPATINILTSLPDDIVNVTLYASGQLPSEFQPVLRDTKDTLSDYQTIAKGKINLSIKDPFSDEVVAREAQSIGIQPVRFNVVSQEEFQIKEGYLGLVVSYGGERETLPFIQNTRDLEYQLSSFLVKLTTENKPIVGFISGHGEKSFSEEYRGIIGEWKKQFEVKEIIAEKNSSTKEKEENSDKNLLIPDEVRIIIVAGPTENFSDNEKKTIADFLAKGGKAFFLVDGVSISPRTMSASKNESNFIEFLKSEMGISVGSDLLYDLRANESISFGGGQMQYIAPYPFWIRAQRMEGSLPIASSIKEISVPWVSSIESDESVLNKNEYKKIDLFSTTPFAGRKSEDFVIDPNQKFPQSNLKQQTLAVALVSEKDEKSSRIVVVGDSDFLADQFVGNNPANLSFGLETLSWLGQEASLGSITAKNSAVRKFSFTNASDPSILKFGNMVFAFLIVSGYGMWRLFRRNRKKRFSYESYEEEN